MPPACRTLIPHVESERVLSRYWGQRSCLGCAANVLLGTDLGIVPRWLGSRNVAARVNGFVPSRIKVQC